MHDPRDVIVSECYYLTETNRKLQRKVDNLTHMLYGLCNEVKDELFPDKTREKHPIDAVEGLSDWWYEHQSKDIKRVLASVSHILDDDDIEILKKNIDSL